MKRISFFYFCIFCLFLLNGVKEGLYAQTEAQIRAAGRTVTDAGTALRAHRQFSDSLPWLFGGDVTMNLRSTELSNWAGGGENQLAFNAITNMYYNYRKDRRTWENYLTLAYGTTRTGGRAAIKSDDRIQFKSKVGHQMRPQVFYTASFLMRNQFAAGYRYTRTDTTLISHFMAPVNMFVSVGLDWRPNPTFSLNVSPLMGRATYVRRVRSIDDENFSIVLSTAGIPRETNETTEEHIERRSRHEFGGGVFVSYRGNIFRDRVSYNTTLDLFSNYVDKPQNITVFWTFSSKILIYRNISADFRLELRYDDKQKTLNEDGTMGGPKIQTRTLFGIGLFYQF